MTDTKVLIMKIKPEAQEKIKQYVTQGQTVLLSLNDGSNKYSKVGGTCTIGANFQLVILEGKDPEYNVPINNDMGLKLFTAKPELTFLSDNLVINLQNSTLSLSDDSGLIDGAMSIGAAALSDVTEDDLKNGKTC